MTTRDEAVVLVVGGWSPGPLHYLHSVMTTRSCIVVQPRVLPMPPFPSWSWCCHPKVLLAMALCGVLMWLATLQHQSILWKVLAILAAMVSLPILAAVAVRMSIQVGTRSCLEAIQHLHCENLVLVGFSWGGAIISELLVQHHCPFQPSTRKRLKVLLIAPTTSLVSSIAMQQDTALQLPCNDCIHVVHGIDDGAFCPHQDRWSGQNVHRIHDNHIFYQPSSQRFLKSLLMRFLDEAMASTVTDETK